MTPIKITAHLMGGLAVSLAEGITLDGPLAWAAVLERMGEEAFSRSPTNDVLTAECAEPDPGIPLAIHRAGGLWLYQVSLAEVHGHAGTDMRHWNKRFDDGLAQAYIDALDLTRRSKVNTKSAEFKSYHQPTYIEQVERLSWYAVGDPDAVRHLLTEHITHLGKKWNRGSGIVTGWEVEASDALFEDRWLWREDGSPARAIPTSMLSDWSGEVAWAGYRPPYWLAAHQTWCAVPTPMEVATR